MNAFAPRIGELGSEDGKGWNAVAMPRFFARERVGKSRAGLGGMSGSDVRVEPDLLLNV
jgi:hypothetical protein